MQTCSRALEQTPEILNETVQLQHALPKLMNEHLVGFLEAICYIESQISPHYVRSMTSDGEAGIFEKT